MGHNYRKAAPPIRKPFLASLIFCENIRQTEQGKINLEGVFQSLGLPADYNKLPLQVSLWLHFEGLEPLTQYDFGIRQKTPVSGAYQIHSSRIESSFDGSLDISSPLTITAPLPEWYDLDFLFDGVPAGIRRLSVIRHPQQPNVQIRRLDKPAG